MLRDLRDLRDLRGVAKAGCLGLAVAVLGAWRWKERRGKSLRGSTCVTCLGGRWRN